eukprot:COSAG02_NODE_2742_length_8122_cov_34.555472_4_plen_1402_part_00
MMAERGRYASPRWSGAAAARKPSRDSDTDSDGEDVTVSRTAVHAGMPRQRYHFARSPRRPEPEPEPEPELARSTSSNPLYQFGERWSSLAMGADAAPAPTTPVSRSRTAPALVPPNGRAPGAFQVRRGPATPTARRAGQAPSVPPQQAQDRGDSGDSLGTWLAGAKLQAQEKILRAHGIGTVDDLLRSGVPSAAVRDMPAGVPERLQRALARQQRKPKRPKPLPPARGPPPPLLSSSGLGAATQRDEAQRTADFDVQRTVAPLPTSTSAGGRGKHHTSNGQRGKHPSSMHEVGLASRAGRPHLAVADVAASADSRVRLPLGAARNAASERQPPVRLQGSPPASSRPPRSPAPRPPSIRGPAPGLGGLAFPSIGAGANARRSITSARVLEMMQLSRSWEATDNDDPVLRQRQGNKRREILTLVPTFTARARAWYMLQVAAGFPGSVVFSDQRNPRRAQFYSLIFTALVFCMPPLLVYVAIGGLEEQDLLYRASGGLELYVELVVTLVTVAVLTPVLLELAKSIRLYTSIDTVLPEGMIFRPRLTPRLTMDNLAAITGFIVEFFSHVNAGMTSDYLGFIQPTEYRTWTGEMHPGSDTTTPVLWNGAAGSWMNSSMIETQSNATGTAQTVDATVVVSAYRPTAAATVVKTVAEGEESLPQILAALYLDAFSICFWTSALCVLFNQIVYILRLVLPGKWGWFWSNDTLYAELIWAEGVYFINGPLFLPILMFLYRAFECHYPTDGQPPLLRANPEIVCWDGGYHSAMVVVSLFCIGIYVPTATLLPSTSFRETMRENLDFLFSSVYLQVSFVLKCVLMFVRIMFGESDWIKVPGVLAIHIVLLLLNVKMQPCCVPTINLWRTASFCGIVWVGICGVVHLAFDRPDGELQILIVVMTVLGWLLILIGTLLVQFAEPQSPLQVAAEAFAAFEYAAKDDVMPPRALEPLIALSMSKDKDAAEAVFLKADFAEQLLRLLRRSACIPGDTIGETTGVHYRRARLHRRLTRSVVHAGVKSANVVKTASKQMLEVTNIIGAPPATPATPDRNMSDMTGRQTTLFPASPAQHLANTVSAAGMTEFSPMRSTVSTSLQSHEGHKLRVNVRVQFATAWSLANIAQRGDRFIAKILEASRKLRHTHGPPSTVVTYADLADDDAEKDDPPHSWDAERAYVVEVFVWVLEQARGESQIALQLEILAALTNLTQDTGFARLVGTVHYEWPPDVTDGKPDTVRFHSACMLDTLQRALTSDIERVASFSALILANLARQSEALRLRLHDDHSAVYALTLLCRSSDTLTKKAAVLGLSNLAQSAELAKVMVDPDVKTIKAVVGVAKHGIAAVSLECATFFANMGCHAAVVDLLRRAEQAVTRRDIEDALRHLRWSHFERVRSRAVGMYKQPQAPACAPLLSS